MENKERYYDIIIRDLKNADVEPIVRQLEDDGKFSNEKRYLRVWKLGSLEHKVYPSQDAFEKLKNVLQKWDGYSTIDIIWDSALTVEVFQI